MHKRKTITVDIPAGVDDETQIRVRGEGEDAGAKGQSGDLYINIRVKPDPRFRREGSRIFSEVKIGFSQAALGDVMKVQTIDGVVEMKVPAGTQSGEEFRLRGKGVPSRTGRGDHIVTVRVVTPAKLSAKERELLEKLDHRLH